MGWAASCFRPGSGRSLIATARLLKQPRAYSQSLYRKVRRSRQLQVPAAYIEDEEPGALGPRMHEACSSSAHAVSEAAACPPGTFRCAPGYVGRPTLFCGESPQCQQEPAPCFGTRFTVSICCGIELSIFRTPTVLQCIRWHSCKLRL